MKGLGYALRVSKVPKLGPAFAAALGFLGLTIFYCRDAVFLGNTLIGLGGDEEVSFYSSLVYSRDWFQQGIFPLWDTLTKCGGPFGLFSVSIHDFFHLAVMSADPDMAYSGVKIAGFFLSGWVFYLFLVQRGYSSFAAWCAGALWAIVSSHGNPESGFFLLPLAFLAAERWLALRTKSAFAALVASLVLYDLNSNPQVFLYGSLFLYFYMAGHPRLGLGWRPKCLAVAPFLFAAALTFFYFARMFELALLSNRSSWKQILVLLPTHYILFFFPKIFTAPGIPELDFMVPRILQGIFAKMGLHRLDTFSPPPYLGIFAAFAFIVFAARIKKYRPVDPSRYFFWAGVVVLCYLTFHPIVFEAIVSHIPFVKGMTNVTRAFRVLEFCGAVLAAAWIDRLLAGSAAENRRSPLSIKAVAFFSASLLAVLAAIKVALMIFKDQISRIVLSSIPFEHTGIFIQDEKSFRAERLDQFFKFFETVASPDNPHLWMPLLWIAVLLGLLWMHRAGRLNRRVFQASLVFFLLADLGAFYGWAMPSVRPQSLWVYRDLASQIRRLEAERSDPYRVLVIEDATRPFVTMFLRPQSSLTYGIATPDGYEQLYIKRYVKFYTHLTRRDNDAGYVLHPTHDFDETLADVINCRYVLTSQDNTLLDGRQGYRKVFETQGHKLYRNLDALSRVFAIREVVGVPDAAAAESYIRDHAERLREAVVLEGSPSEMLGPAGRGKDTIQIIRYEPNHVRVEADLAQEAYLVMSDVFFPGWKARLDGQPVEIKIADLCFRAVRVPQGRHVLDWDYRPDSMKWGLLVSLLGVVALILFMKFML